MITGQCGIHGLEIFIFVSELWIYNPKISIVMFVDFETSIRGGIFFFRLITDTEEGVNVEVNNPGSYNTVSVELDMASLAVNTLIQVSWFELSSCSFLMLSSLKSMVQSLRPETCTEVKMDVNGIGLLDFGEEWVSNPFASIITVLSRSRFPLVWLTHESCEYWRVDTLCILMCFAVRSCEWLRRSKCNEFWPDPTNISRRHGAGTGRRNDASKLWWDGIVFCCFQVFGNATQK